MSDAYDRAAKLKLLAEAANEIREVVRVARPDLMASLMGIYACADEIPMEWYDKPLHDGHVLVFEGEHYARLVNAGAAKCSDSDCQLCRVNPRRVPIFDYGKAAKEGFIRRDPLGS